MYVEEHKLHLRPFAEGWDRWGKTIKGKGDINSSFFSYCVRKREGEITVASLHSRLARELAQNFVPHVVWSGNHVLSHCIRKYRIIFSLGTQPYFLHPHKRPLLYQDTKSQVFKKYYRKKSTLFNNSRSETKIFSRFNLKWFLERQIMSKKWGWIDHVLKRGQNGITRASLDWNLRRNRKFGHPKTSFSKQKLLKVKIKLPNLLKLYYHLGVQRSNDDDA